VLICVELGWLRIIQAAHLNLDKEDLTDKIYIGVEMNDTNIYYVPSILHSKFQRSTIKFLQAMKKCKTITK
jgi:hypothetical protein